jgi:predicted tellurium resistance membrane protein TerC
MMENFSYIWIFILFILQIVSIGIILGKLNEERIHKYSLSSLILNIIFSVLTGISLYKWPN